MSEQKEEVSAGIDLAKEGEESKTIHVFVTVKNGEVKSFLSNVANIDFDLIDEDLGEIDEEISESNDELLTKQTELYSEYEMYEYIPSAQDPEEQAAEEVK